MAEHDREQVLVGRVLELLHDPALVLGEERCLYANPAFEDTFGHNPAELTADLAALASEDAREPLKLLLLRTTLPTARSELLLRTHDGEPLVCEVATAVVRWEGRRAVLALFHDLSEQRRAARVLEQSESRLRQVIDLVPHFIFAKDRQGRFILVNEALAGAYGTTVEDLLGRTDADFNTSREEVQAFLRDDNEVMDSGAPKLIPEEAITDATGRQRLLRTTKIPFTLSGTAQDAVLGVAVDITEQRRAEREALELEHAAQRSQRLESLGILAGGIAHDFNNLLVGVLGNAELLQTEIPEDSPVASRLEQIVAAAQQASHLTNQMLAYAGKSRFTIEPTDISALVQELLPLLGSSIPKKVTVKTELTANLATVSADVAQLRQVVMNLILNSAEAIGDGEGTVTIRTAVEHCSRRFLRATLLGQELGAGPYVCLEVKDTGCGIDADQLERIFDPFFSTKFAGRGLGLSAVVGIIRGHRGTLDVRSSPGQGTTFRIYLPPDQRTARQAAPRPAPVAASSRVLVVDDEEVVLKVALAALQRAGHDTLVARNGREAVEIFRKEGHSIDMVLLDQAMPGMSGDEALEAMRAVRPDVPVILCSGFGETEAARRFAGKGVSFLQKPFRLARLLEAVGKALA